MKERNHVVTWPLDKCHITLKANGDLFIRNERNDWAFVIGRGVRIIPESSNIRDMALAVGETTHVIAKKLSEVRSGKENK